MVKEILPLIRILLVLISFVISKDVVDGRGSGNIMHDNNKINKDGTCRLQTILPFSLDVRGTNTIPELKLLPLLLSSLPNNVGYSYLSAVLMAMEHFNERNPVVVKQLKGFKYQKSNCNFTFDMDISSFIDSGGMFSHLGIQNSFEDFVNNGIPCAIAGPYSEVASNDASKLSTAAKIPMVIAKSFAQRLGNENVHPMISQVSPGFAPVADIVYQFLMKYNRDNYYNLLYQSSDIGLYMHEVISQKFEKENKKYLSYDSFAWAQERGSNEKTIKSETFVTMKKMKENGFRTIIIIVEVLIDIFFIADAAERLNMTNNDEYLYVFIGSFEISGAPEFLKVVSLPNLFNLLRGSAFITPVESYMVDPDNDPFLKEWKTNDERFVRLVNSKYPIRDNPREMGYYQGTDNYFQNFEPQIGSAFMYDAVMSIGLGACLAPPSPQVTKSNNDDNIECSSSSDNTKMCSTNNDFNTLHLQGIRDVGFHGATGVVIYGGENDRYPGSRNSVTSMYGVVNLFPPHLGNDSKKEDIAYVITDYAIGYSNGLTKLHDFVFSNNTTKPPSLLRNPPEQNYLDSSAMTFGIVLMLIAVTFSIFCGAWVFWFRLHRIVTASQPIFLYLLCFGCGLFSLSIFFISFDEGSGYTPEHLGVYCMASRWCICIGHLLIYGALFTKLWRINKVLQFRRAKVKLSHVAWPLSALMVATILILIFWTILSPLRWERTIMDDLTEESFGKCSGNFGPSAALFPLAVIPCLLTCYMAYKTKDIEDTYAESKWIFVLVLVQIQMVVSAAPVLVLLGRGNVSTNARYIGTTIFFWSYSMTALLLVIVPKMVAHYYAVNGKAKPSVVRGGSSGGMVHISGLSNQDFTNSASKSNSQFEKRLQGF